MSGSQDTVSFSRGQSWGGGDLSNGFQSAENNRTFTEIFRNMCGMGRSLTEELEVRSLGVSGTMSTTIYNIGPEGNVTCPGEDSPWKAFASEFALRSGAFL